MRRPLLLVVTALGLCGTGLGLLALGLSWAAIPATGAEPGTCTVNGVVEVNGKARGPVVVYETSANGPAPTHPVYAQIGQHNKSFDHDAVVVSVGAEVAFPNTDVVHHHLYSHSRQDPFEFDKHAPKANPSRYFDESGDSMVRCNIHPNMETHVLVVPNAWAVMADPQTGAFQISGITPGSHEVEAWSAGHRPKRLDFVCEPGGTVVFNPKLRQRSPPPPGDYQDQ